MKLFAEDYVAHILRVVKDCDETVTKAANVIRNSSKEGKTLWILGNGGSLALAQHFAQDLVKLRGIRAQTVNCPSIITAYTNDVDFEQSFALPLDIIRRDGDPVMIFSCSGSSRNYREIADSKAYRPLIAVVGTDGGFLRDAADVCIHVRDENYQLCETAFSLIADLINFELEE